MDSEQFEFFCWVGGELFPKGNLVNLTEGVLLFSNYMYSLDFQTSHTHMLLQTDAPGLNSEIRNRINSDK